MPLRNRVTPFGEILAVPGRGALMGNRGVLHNTSREIVRDSATKRWIACRLEFKGRHRELMQPNRWTELFFLDEAAAFAAGHRPCAECRHDAFVRFKSSWQAVYGPGPWPVNDIDARLHQERRGGPWRKRTYVAPLAGLPDGAYVALDDQAWLVLGEGLHEWSPTRYLTRRPRSTGSVTVLTPRSLVSVLAAGYQPQVHGSAYE